MADVIEDNNSANSAPKWLNQSYFSDILQEQYGQCEIINFQVNDALAKGENYASIMHRVTIDLKSKGDTTETASYIAKTSVDSKVTGEMFGHMSVFPREIEMYDEVVPLIEAIFKESGVDVIFGPKCVKTQQDPPVIVLEDLKVKKYENIDRLEGMDLKHTEATLSTLAQFHAASVRIFQKRGPFSEKLNKIPFTEEIIEIMGDMFESVWPTMEKCIKQWGDCEKYLEKIKNLTLRLPELINAVERVDEMEFNVLLHGDMWSNNIMFQHNDDGTINDVKFIDLQMCRWGSPVQDLQYFIINSCNYDIRIKKFDYLIEYYHNQLVRNLKLVKWSGEPITLQGLQEQMFHRRYCSVSAAFGSLAFVLLERSDNAEIEHFITNTEKSKKMRIEMFTNPRYVKTIKALLPFMDERGILDV